MNVRKPNLAFYQEQLKGRVCKDCLMKASFRMVPLENEPIEHYDHSDGWPLEGHEELQWLYVECPQCKYQWSLRKLGVPREQKA